MSGPTYISHQFRISMCITQEQVGGRRIVSMIAILTSVPLLPFLPCQQNHAKVLIGFAEVTLAIQLELIRLVIIIIRTTSIFFFRYLFYYLNQWTVSLLGLDAFVLYISYFALIFVIGVFIPGFYFIWSLAAVAKVVLAIPSNGFKYICFGFLDALASLRPMIKIN